jgi:hypothetical protein
MRVTLPAVVAHDKARFVPILTQERCKVNYVEEYGLDTNPSNAGRVYISIFQATCRAGSGGRTTMKHFIFLIAFSGLLSVVSGTTQAAYYHHRHHHHWYHGAGGSYWNYYRTSWPGRGVSEESQR